MMQVSAVSWETHLIYPVLRGCPYMCRENIAFSLHGRGYWLLLATALS